MSYEVSKHVDYLAATSHQANLGHFSTRAYQIVKPVNNAYDNAEMHQSGMMHMWNARNSKLGHHYIMSGKALEWIRKHVMSDADLCAQFLSMGHISRIDIACTSRRADGLQHELRPQEIMEMCRDGKLKSRLAPNNEIALNGITQTKYIGNPHKRRRLFRAYDKGIQMDLEAHKLVRYELETGMNADVVARMLIAGNDIGAIIRRYVDFPESAVWCEILGTDNSELKHETREIEIDAHEKSRLERIAKWQWLNSSIAPMVANLINENMTLDDITLYENTYWSDLMHEISKRLYRNGQ